MSTRVKEYQRLEGYRQLAKKVCLKLITRIKDTETASVILWHASVRIEVVVIQPSKLERKYQEKFMFGDQSY